MTVEHDCSFTDDAGAYALSAMSEIEARRYSAHLDGCAQCRQTVGTLQGVVDTLPMAAPAVVLPPALKGRLMAVVRAEAELLRAAGPQADVPVTAARRRWFGPWSLRLAPLPAAALASVLLALGVGGGVLLRSGGDERPAARVVAAKAVGDARVAVEVRGERATLVMAGMPRPRAGTVYQVWLKRGAGAPRPTHTLFNVRSDGRARVEIEESVRNADRVLVTAEPSGGSVVPTSAPVIDAQLS